MKNIFLACFAAVLLFANSFAQGEVNYFAFYADKPIIIDGIADESVWQAGLWYNIDQLYLGEANANFSGRFKTAWLGNQIYFLVEIIDSNLTNFISQNFSEYWQGDCIEIFIDEALNKSDHHQNNKAFAYHIMHTGEVIDIDTDGSSKIFPDTAKIAIKQDGNKYTWEIALNVYSEKYNPNIKNNKKALVKLFAGKKLGLTLAYGDNNGEGREAFYGSAAGQGDTGYLTSEKFGILELVK